MKIRIKSNCKKSCPGDQVTRSYLRGRLITCDFEASKFPGKPYTQGTYGYVIESRKQNSSTPINKDWVFWSSSDIQKAVIFQQIEVDQLYLNQEQYEQLTAEAINSATFQIIIQK
jgi:hypothetical protein